ncbi:jerky protein-like [Anoplolepis gracilipes]|uniref:jerky protein-like n=1 Tax=Anoplolepis gracilipes TaxID=354296 RepID=UPI003B9F005C
MAHPTDLWTNQPLAVANFIQKFNDRLKEKNIIEDNVYNMVKTTFESWETMLMKNVNKIVNIEKFKEVQITAVFCANATNSNKLPPFFIFKNDNEKIKEYAIDQSEFISKTEQDMLTKESEIFAYWYRNYFMEHVRKYQKMKAKNVNNKVILLLKVCKEFSSLLEVKESDFETMYFPTCYVTHLQPLHKNLIINFRQKIRNHTFPNSTNIKDCLNFISNSWTTSFQDKVYFHLWNKLFQRNVIEENTVFKEIPEDLQSSGPKKLQKEEATIGEIVEPVLSMEENNPSPSFGTPKLELNKNVIEENTVFKEVPEDPQNSDPEKLQQEEAAIEEITGDTY